MSIAHVHDLIIGSGVVDTRSLRHCGAAGPFAQHRAAGRGQGECRIRCPRHIRVNDRLQTSAPDVWATGECAGSPQFTHVGVDDYRIVLDNLAGVSRTTRGRLIPYCLFTDPDLAHVGLTESEARTRGRPQAGAIRPGAGEPESGQFLSKNRP
jgi:pyruvate/2-oxoglutarate dehydrogenase complex dihydrolipoamide dehydrogenase (E3) component